jgi:hypothetical protein
MIAIDRRLKFGWLRMISTEPPKPVRLEQERLVRFAPELDQRSNVMLRVTVMSRTVSFA